MSLCLIKRLTLDGLRDVDYEADTLANAVKYEPQDGVYTVANTLNTFDTLKLNDHLDRLEDSARRAGIIDFTLDRTRLRGALREMITDADVGSVRFRVTVPRDHQQTLILSIEPFKPLSEAFIERGVRCITAPNSARDNPAAKTTDWMHARKSLSDAMPEGIYDTILLDANGNMMEGLGANFYAIKDDMLFTAGEGVLGGIAQQIMFEIAPNILPVVKLPVNHADLEQVEEAFITSSSRGIVPIVEIDGFVLGDSTPGTQTRALRESYNRWVDANLEPL